MGTLFPRLSALLIAGLAAFAAPLRAEQTLDAPVSAAEDASATTGTIPAGATVADVNAPVGTTGTEDPFPLDFEQDDASDIPPTESTWKGAIKDSLRLLMIEHSMRVAFQDKTRRELGGPFWQDYARSVKVPRTWEDGDGWKVNYVGHPVHGAASGFIWLDHEDGAHDPALGFSGEYWSSRGRALAWATAYSLQFEFGPLSEASIGNVGLRPNTTGWVDHVVTPAGALGFMVAEDAIDRYLMVRLERWTGNRVVLAVLRTVLNPSRTMSNTAQGRLPWYRAARPLPRR